MNEALASMPGQRIERRFTTLRELPPLVLPLFVLPLLVLTGCSGEQSALHSQGLEADVVARLSWTMFIGGAFVLLLVFGLLMYALLRRADRRMPIQANWFIFAGGVALPTVTLTVLLFYALSATKNLRAAGADPEHDIELIGHQWWWEVRYLGSPDEQFTTANELNLPRGERTRIKVSTADVIHSFWVPSLAGKIDLIPGRQNEIVLEPTGLGIFRAQCAEFCGAQHARMALYVVVHEPTEFEEWRAREREPAMVSTDALASAGRDVFFQAACAYCHTIRGTRAGGGLGPDLTHIGSRRSIAAGTLNANRGNLSAWIVHAQQIKPGNMMPSFRSFRGEELRALSAYLESLE